VKRNTGFTLVDLMVALAILAIVLSAVFALFHSHERTVRAAGEERDLYAEAALILDRLTHDITGAWLPTLPSEGQAKYAFAAEPGRLDFTTTAGLVPGAPVGSEIVEVGYRLETTDDESGLLRLIRRQDNTVDDTPDDGGWTIVLSQRIIRMTVMYADSNGQMDETFNTEQRSELPQMIAITLVMADANDRGKTFATTVSPALAQGVVPNLFENGDLTQ
jgi:prepilin-type N-terminal cleavage/methylation domain-containing protein